MVAVCRFVDRDMMMRYHWGHGVGHIYAFTSDLGQEELVGDNDGDIGDGEKTSDTAEVGDSPVMMSRMACHGWMTADSRMEILVVLTRMTLTRKTSIW